MPQGYLPPHGLVRLPTRRCAPTSPHGGEELFLRLDYFAVRVVAAVSTDRVRSRQLLAVGTRLQLHMHQGKMRAPATFLRFGELDLRQSHGCRILPDRVR